MADRDLKKKTVHGLLWSAINNFSIKGIQFLLMLFMARLLAPEAYGAIGMITVFISVSAIFVDSGFCNALIRKKEVTNEDLSTVFWFNILISICAYVVVFFISPYVADFYNMPILCPTLRVLGITIITEAFKAVQIAYYTINLNFKQRTKILVSATFISGIIGVILAFLGFGVWALVFQSITGSIISGCLYWFLSSWHPSFLFSKKSFLDLFGYGSKMLASSILTTLYNNIYPIAIGKIYSASDLGHYTRASHYASFLSSNLTNIVQAVSLPVLAKIQDNDKQLRDYYRRMLRTSAFVIFPLMMLLSALSYPIVIILIGKQWEFCTQLLKIICFSMMWYPIHAINLNLLQVKGRSDLFLKLEIIKKIIGLCVLAVSIPLGLIAMCYFGILSSIISLFINTYYTGKLLKLGFISQMKDLSPTLLLSLFVFICVSFVANLIPNLYAQLLVGGFLGGILYISGSYLFKFPELKEVISMFLEMKNR